MVWSNNRKYCYECCQRPPHCNARGIRERSRGSLGGEFWMLIPGQLNKSLLQLDPVHRLQEIWQNPKSWIFWEGETAPKVEAWSFLRWRRLEDGTNWMWKRINLILSLLSATSLPRSMSSSIKNSNETFETIEMQNTQKLLQAAHNPLFHSAQEDVLYIRGLVWLRANALGLKDLDVKSVSTVQEAWTVVSKNSQGWEAAAFFGNHFSRIHRDVYPILDDFDEYEPYFENKGSIQNSGPPSLRNHLKSFSSPFPTI